MKISPVDKKRWELWGIAFFLLLTSAAAIVVFSVVTEQPLAVIIFLAVIFLLFCAYVIENEFKLQRLQHQLQDEQFNVLEKEVRLSNLESRLKELAVLQKAMEAIGMETQPEKALDAILGAAMELFGADRGSIMLVHEASRTLVIAAAVGIQPEYVAKSRPKIGEGIAGHVAETGEAILLPPKFNTDQYKNFETKAMELRSGICAPLRSRNRIIGVINYTIVDSRKRLFTEYDLKLLTIFAQYATLVIDAAGAARLK